MFLVSLGLYLPGDYNFQGAPRSRGDHNSQGAPRASGLQRHASRGRGPVSGSGSYASQDFGRSRLARVCTR